MLVLLCGSALFSAAETAFFNLSKRQLNLLQSSTGRISRLVAHLSDRPRQLLGCLLLGNMMVNVLFFALASVVNIHVEQRNGLSTAAVTTFVSISALILFGEVVPKSLAYANSRLVSTAAAPLVFVFFNVFSPIIFFFRFLIVEPVVRLLLGTLPASRPITAGEFKSLIEMIRRQGLISPDENKLLAEIIDFGFLKVRHVMRPRVDVVACRVTESPDFVREIMLKNQLVKLVVYDGPVDNIIGMVNLRRLLLQPAEPIARLIEPVYFVPEHKTVESLLEFFRRHHTDMAVVVDEYGGMAGLVFLEDVAEELLGPTGSEDSTPPIELIGPMEYRLSGSLAIHDWADSFGIELSRSRLATVGGLVTALLGRIPKRRRRPAAKLEVYSRTHAKKTHRNHYFNP